MGTVLDTITYTYGDTNWGDLLTAYDGTAITYDGIGNPLSGGTWSYAWQNGRELASMTSGDTTWYYIYDADGMRTSRTTDGAEYIYEYIGGQLTHMSYGITTMHFTYDAAGRPATVIHNGTVYYYVTNLQGDVVALLDSTGAQVVGYTYDAWGRLLSTTGSKASTLGLYNPLRYRGYVYDRETGLYYLQSRYYNPTIGRFINADAFTSTGQGLLGNNMFAYCNNNPVCNADPTGTILTIVSIPIFCGVVNNMINAIYYEFSDGESELTPASYQDEHVSRWEKLDYTKQQTGEAHYNTNAWRYYNEYSIHEVGWNLTGWAYKKDIPVVSALAEKFYSAEVYTDKWDDRWYVNVATVLWGLLGF